MRIIGLDLSLTRTGISTLDKRDGLQLFEESTWSVKTTPKESLQRRIDLITDWILKSACSGVICVVFIEGQAMGIISGRSFDRSELAGVVKYRLYKVNVPFHLVPPTVLKKYVTGKSTGEKALMLHQVAKRMGYEAPNDDCADAYALADFGYHALFPDAPRRKLLVPELDVIAKYKKDNGWTS